jgi:hypothetical protein
MVESEGVCRDRYAVVSAGEEVESRGKLGRVGEGEHGRQDKTKINLEAYCTCIRALFFSALQHADNMYVT